MYKNIYIDIDIDIQCVQHSMCLHMCFCVPWYSVHHNGVHMHRDTDVCYFI